MSRLARLERVEAALSRRRRPDPKAQALARLVVALRGSLGLRAGDGADEPVRALRQRLALGAATGADLEALAALRPEDLDAAGMTPEGVVDLLDGVLSAF